MVLGIIYPVCWPVYHCHIAVVTECTYTCVRTGGQISKVIAPKGLAHLKMSIFVF